jgi:hypothetical protein
VIVQLMSDLHLDFPGAREIPKTASEVDLVLVAGDTCEGLVKAVELLRDGFPKTEVATVAGNHEYYGRCLPDELEAGRRRARELGVHLLEMQTAFFGPLRVVGATGWTDYELFGHALLEPAMRTASKTMRDHQRIAWRKDPWQRFRPIEARQLHMASRRYIEAELAKPHAATLVMTHHAVTLDAVAPPFQRSLASAAFASELLPVVDRCHPRWWLTGHTHCSLRLRRGSTLLISNPAGYPGENTSFDPSFCIEVSDD